MVGQRTRKENGLCEGNLICTFKNAENSWCAGAPEAECYIGPRLLKTLNDAQVVWFLYAENESFWRDSHNLFEER